MGAAVVVQDGEQLDVGVGEAQVFAAGQQLAHDAGGLGCPHAAFHAGDGAVLEVVLGEVLDEFPHEGENIPHVGGGCQHQPVVAEGVGHGGRQIAAGQVVEDDGGGAPLPERLGQQFHGGFGAAVDGGVGDDDALRFRAVGGPGIVQADVVAQVFGQDRAVERADPGDVQGGGLFQQVLYLYAELAHDADVIAAGFIIPGLLHVQGTEFAEGIGGEQHFVVGVIGHNDLRPVHHGGGDEAEGVFAQGQGVPVADHHAAVGIVGAEHVLHHQKGQVGGHYHCFRVMSEEHVDVGGVVRLHVLDDEVIRGAAPEPGFQVLQPFPAEACVYGVKDGDLLVQDHVGVVGNAVGDGVLAFKQVGLAVIDADILNVVGDEHSRFSFVKWDGVLDFLRASYYTVGKMYVEISTKGAGNEGNIRCIAELSAV